MAIIGIMMQMAILSFGKNNKIQQKAPFADKMRMGLFVVKLRIEKQSNKII